MGRQRQSGQPFERLSIGKCYVQTANDRFGDEASKAIIVRERAEFGQWIGANEQPFTWPGAESDDGNDGHRSIYRIVPSTQRFRNNLTALAQAHNLYFVAYQGRIFVYKPRSAPAQTLPSSPDLQLASKPSAAAGKIGGYLDRRNPHLINHLVTGFLGREEIVLTCYDDGDVIAYYIKDVAEWIATHPQQATSSHSNTPPKPFFHENVGKTAWGLAVHQKSRLIAVSSNRHEVTVFAFGLVKASAQASDALAKAYEDQHASTVLERDRNWRIVVLYGPECDNIPNICFVDDANGDAEKMCAIDIGGAVWLADIWKSHQPSIRIAPLPGNLVQSEEFWPEPSRGWGILALPESSFMRVKHIDELFGIPLDGCFLMQTPGAPGKVVANTIACLDQVPGNPRPVSPPRQLDRPDIEAGHFDLAHLDNPFEEAVDTDDEIELPEDDVGLEDEDSSEDGDQLGGFDINQFFDTETTNVSSASMISMDSIEGSSTNPGKMRPAWPNRDRASDDAWSRGLPDHLDMAYFPHNGLVKQVPRDHEGLVRFLTRPMEANNNQRNCQESLQQLSNKLHLLRTYEKDIELQSYNRSREFGVREVGVLCGQALTSGRIHPGIRHLFTATSRLNMIAHMPELSAVAVGSAIGRVLLLTLTRKSLPFEQGGLTFEHGFRVDWILPTMEQEEAHRKMPRPLHGMAAGPIYDSNEGTSGRAQLPRRYRLMLHYRTHDILSYEITRNEETGKLCIF